MGQYSFTKAERLLKSKDFALVKKDGKRITVNNLIIFLKTNDIGIRRLGLAVSSKVGGAVKRNRIKRILREIFRLNKEVFPASNDIFISVRQGFNPKWFKEIEKEIKTAVLNFQGKHK